MLRFNVQDDGIYDWMILMEEQNKMRDVRPGYRLLPKGFVPPENNSSVAANHHSSVNQSASVANDGSQQLASPTSYAMSPMIREVNTSRTDTPQRVTPLPQPDYRMQQPMDGRRPSENRFGNGTQHQQQQPPQSQSQKNKGGKIRRNNKWWHKLFRWCHKGSDTDSRG